MLHKSKNSHMVEVQGNWGAVGSCGGRLSAHGRGWNSMIFKVPSSPNHSVPLWCTSHVPDKLLYALMFVQGACSTWEGSLPPEWQRKMSPSGSAEISPSLCLEQCPTFHPALGVKANLAGSYLSSAGVGIAHALHSGCVPYPHLSLGIFLSLLL